MGFLANDFRLAINSSCKYSILQCPLVVTATDLIDALSILDTEKANQEYCERKKITFAICILYFDPIRSQPSLPTRTKSYSYRENEAFFVLRLSPVCYVNCEWEYFYPSTPIAHSAKRPNDTKIKRKMNAKSKSNDLLTFQ